MPAVGYGCWKIAGDVAAESVYTAIKNGYRLIDGAASYDNEVQVGQGIKRAIDEGIVKREDLFITTKLWVTYHRKENVKPALQRSLSDMGLDYVDLYLIHAPLPLKFVPMETRYPPGLVYEPDDKGMGQVIEDEVPIQETWTVMEECVGEGLAKHIGVSCFPSALLRDVCAYAKVKPACNQIEIHPFNSQSQLIRFCKDKNIAVTGYSSFGGQSWIEIHMAE